MNAFCKSTFTIVIFIKTLIVLLAKGSLVCQPPDSPIRGSYDPFKTEYKAGDELNYYCDKSAIDGPSKRTCQLNGTWTGSTPFCDEPVKLKNPQIRISGSNPVNAIDDHTETCTHFKQGTLDIFNAYLEVPADIIRIRLYLKKGKVNLDVGKTSKERKSFCGTVNRQLEEDQWKIVTCESNNLADGIYIKENGDSSNSINLCEVQVYIKKRIWCVEPPKDKALNGWLAVARDIAILQCAEGYKPGENDRLVCLNNLEWNHVVLRCDEILCNRVSFDNPKNHWRLIDNVSKLSVGSTKQLRCEKDYVMVGEPDTIQCQPNGTWSNTTAKCKKKPESKEITKTKIIAASGGIGLVIICCFAGFAIIMLRKKKRNHEVLFSRAEDRVTITAEPDSEYSTVAYEYPNESFFLTSQDTNSPRSPHHGNAILPPPPYTPKELDKTGSQDLLEMMKKSPLYNRY